MRKPSSRPTPARTAAAALFVALAPWAATAHAQTLDFNGTGVVAATGPTVGAVQPLLASSSGGYTLGDSSGWSLSAPFSFDFGTGTGSGSFSFTRGDDALSGTLATALGEPGTFALAYTVTGGAGLFAGAGGGGSSVVTLIQAIGPDAFDYAELGQLAVVPEPATWALMLGGAALLAARRRQG